MLTRPISGWPAAHSGRVHWNVLPEWNVPLKFSGTIRTCATGIRIRITIFSCVQVYFLMVSYEPYDTKVSRVIRFLCGLLMVSYESYGMTFETFEPFCPQRRLMFSSAMWEGNGSIGPGVAGTVAARDWDHIQGCWKEGSKGGNFVWKRREREAYKVPGQPISSVCSDRANLSSCWYG